LLAKIIAVLFPDADSVLDLTFGRGGFWLPDTQLAVTGVDLDPGRARDRVADFTELPYEDDAFSLCVFDPPYQTDPGATAVIDARFGSYPTVPELRLAVMAGVREAARVSRIGFVVKVMDYIHASRLVRMSRWVEEAVPLDLYDYVMLESPSKIEDGRWMRHGPQLSARSTATTWLIFRHDGPVHRRIQPALIETPPVARFRRARRPALST
jgi:hypothetical protein